MRLWLDDERPMPSGYDIHVKTSQAAMAVISTMGEFIDEVSLDHDLGDLNGDCGDGYEVACFIEECAHNYMMAVIADSKLERLEAGDFKQLKPFKWNVHSANPTGGDKMRHALKNADHYWARAKTIKTGQCGTSYMRSNPVGEDPTEFEG